MCTNKCLVIIIIILGLCILCADSQYFNGITIQVHRNSTPVTVLRADTINNEYEATTIVIENEVIPVLKTETFSNLTNLQYIILKRNSICEVEAYAFNNLPKARTINLNFNCIKRIYENVFADLPISKLYLKGNGIQALDVYAFKNLTSLETLDLSSNDITSLAEHLFPDTRNLKFLYLNYNRLSEEPEMREVHWTGYFEEPFSHNVKAERSVLDLSSNNFTCLDNNLLKGLVCVKHLLLNNNYMRKVKEYAFRDVAYLDLLDLEGNDLEELPDRVLQKLEDTTDIKLRNNPWKMDFVCKYEKWCSNFNKSNTMDVKCTSSKV
ncbi:hypothetical protein NQ315_011905 [Exocentrus adspersus]|uniref:Uncharacterized protein n=1 Tax=Exocentrus adspersus TaxID=1586481 RepID=A0AAV8W0Y3_9CUCU|nr:hypothetical protein NQ315_011905 [Exocentrus adspersus]